MSEERSPADYTEMDLLEAKRFDKKVKENFIPAIISTVKQIIEDYGVLQELCVDVGCETAVFAIELYKHSKLKIYALEKVKAINEVARPNIEKQQLTNRIIPISVAANRFGQQILQKDLHHWPNLGTLKRNKLSGAVKQRLFNKPRRRICYRKK